MFFSSIFPSGIIDEVELKSFTPKHMQAYLSDFLKNQPEKHSRFSEQLWLFPRNSTDEVFQSLQKRCVFLSLSGTMFPLLKRVVSNGHIYSKYSYKLFLNSSHSS